MSDTLDGSETFTDDCIYTIYTKQQPHVLVPNHVEGL